MNCMPPEDEVYSQRHPTEEEKWEKDATRETRQFAAITSILYENTFSTICILLKMTDRYGLADDPLRFAAKGLLRCDLASDAAGKDWRRLLGTHKSHWIDRKTKCDKLGNKNLRETLKEDETKRDLFKKWMDITPDNEDGIPLPTDWRSRVLFRFFASGAKAKEELGKCPLARWVNSESCPLLDKIKNIYTQTDPFILLNIRDVKWKDEQKFSALLEEFIKDRGGSSQFKYEVSHSCIATNSIAPPLALAPPFPLRKFPLRIFWQVESFAPLHSGMGSEFAKAVYPTGSSLYSRNLRLKKEPENFSHAILISSVKGMMRSAIAWLFEHLALTYKDAFSAPFTSDYAAANWPEQKCCPVRTILGGSGLEGREAHPGRRSLVRIFGIRPQGASLSSYLPGRADVGWQNQQLKFARKIVGSSGGAGFIKVETIDLDRAHQVVTEIDHGHHADAALLAVCLSADLISSGFFRLGRFTSRGFGIIRLRPMKVWAGSLFELLEGKEAILYDSANGGITSGFELLTQKLGFEKPLDQLASWLKSFTK